MKDSVYLFELHRFLTYTNLYQAYFRVLYLKRTLGGYWEKFRCFCGLHYMEEELLDESGGGSFVHEHTCSLCSYKHIVFVDYP